MAAPWRIELLGGLRVQHDDRIITRFQKQKAGALLAYLAYYGDHAHPRDALVDVLWPETDLDAGRNHLRNILYTLRHQLEPAGTPADELVVAHRDTIGLDPAAFSTDVADWHAALHAARQAASPAERASWLIRAGELYRGELLPGFYEDWILTERTLLAEGHLGALHQLVSLLEQAGDRERALEYARRAVSADPLREEAHFDLMRLYAAAGQPSAALRQYQELERLLREELEETPSAVTRALADELRRNARTVVVARGGPPLEPPPSSPPSTQHAARSTQPAFPAPPREVVAADEPLPSAATAAPSTVAEAPALPPQFTRFFGREEEIAWVAEALRAGTRLVTVTGPGGSGKTRLAIAVAGRLIETFGAVWFVPLADVTDARQLPETMAGLLDLPPSPGLEPLERVVRALGRQPSLLVLDNLEHLVAEAAPFIRTLLTRVPMLTCLVTSRQRMNLAGEQEFALLPLRTPKRSDPLERLLEYASVQLFVDRAQAVRPGFQLIPANAEAIATLCDRLEGLPLALELAAARSAVLTPAQMLAHLERRFEFLVSRQRDLPARHRTLLAAMEGSYRLLSPELQRFFARLSVFAGNWTLEAAEHVCVEPRALDFLDQLRECSLVVAEEMALGARRSALGESNSTLTPAERRAPSAEHGSGATMRYRLLETLRQYGVEQLREQGEEAEARGRHLAYFLRWTEAIEPELLGGQHADCYERLESEHDNLRAALAWCKAAPGGAEAGLRLTGVLWRFWDARCYLAEGHQHLADLLSLSETAGRSREASLLAARAKALHGADVLATGRGMASQYLKESLAIWRELGDKRGIAEVLARLGRYMIHDHEESRKLLQESLELYQELGDQPGIATTLSSLGTLAWFHGDYATARPLFEESLAISRRLGNRLQEQSILEMLGNSSLTEGDLAAARSYLEEGLTIAQAFGQKRSIAVGLYFLGQIAFQQGDHRAARMHWEESRRLDRENETKGGAVLGSLAALAAIEGDDEAVRDLWEQSLAEAQELRNPYLIAKALRELAEVARRQRDEGKARSLYAQSLQIERELGNRHGSAECLEGWGRMAGAQGQPERAARLFGAAEALGQAGASPTHRKAQQVRVQDDPMVATARAALGEEAFAAAWAEGRAMTLEQAIAYALAAFPDA